MVARTGSATCLIICLTGISPITPQPDVPFKFLLCAAMAAISSRSCQTVCRHSALRTDTVTILSPWCSQARRFAPFVQGRLLTSNLLGGMENRWAQTKFAPNCPVTHCTRPVGTVDTWPREALSMVHALVAYPMSAVGESQIPDISARSGMFGEMDENVARLCTRAARPSNFMRSTDGVKGFVHASKVTQRAIDEEASYTLKKGKRIRKRVKSFVGKH